MKRQKTVKKNQQPRWLIYIGVIVLLFVFAGWWWWRGTGPEYDLNELFGSSDIEEIEINEVKVSGDENGPVEANYTGEECQVVSDVLAAKFPLNTKIKNLSYNWGGLYEKWFSDRTGQWYYAFLGKNREEKSDFRDIIPAHFGQLNGPLLKQFEQYDTIIMKWDNNNGLKKLVVPNKGTERPGSGFKTPSYGNDAHVVTVNGPKCYLALKPDYEFNQPSVCTDVTRLIGAVGEAYVGKVRVGKYTHENWGKAGEKWFYQIVPMAAKTTKDAQVWFYIIPRENLHRISKETVAGVEPYLLVKWQKGLSRGGRQNILGRDVVIGEVNDSCYKALEPNMVLPVITGNRR